MNTGNNSLPGSPAGETGTYLAEIEQRAERLLRLIEGRSGYVREEARRALEVYFLHDRQEFGRNFEPGYFQNIRLSRGQPGIADLAHSLDQWKNLIPEQPLLKAALLHLLQKKYPLMHPASQRVLAEMGWDAPEVQAAYLQFYGHPLEQRSLEQVDPPMVEAAAANLSPAERAIEMAFASVEWVSLPGGGHLFDRGDSPDALYILVSGRLYSIYSRENEPVLEEDPCAESPTKIELGRGELVGELEVLTGEPRGSTVIAARDSELVRLPATAFFNLVEIFPAAMRRVNRLMAYRLQDQLAGRRDYRTGVVAFAIVLAGESSFGPRVLAEFTWKFVSGLEQYGSTLHLTSAIVDAEWGAGTALTAAEGAANSRLTSWLNEQETHYRYIVYEADSQLNEWTQRCIRQADRVLAVSPSGQNHALNPTEQFLYSYPGACTDLVLFHPPETILPAGTSDWLEPRCLAGHYHIRSNEPADLQRLVRIQTGRALRLVLGGGGARGFAHIGVLQAMRENGFSPDIVGGTSMGAIMAGVLALGRDDQAIKELARRFSSPLKLFDLTLPLVAFFSSGKVSDVLETIFQDTQIEDLWLPFFCVSSNLSRAVPVIHLTGSLWEALRASSAIPGIFSPVLFNGDLLVDGAVLNNLPVDVMQDMGHGGPIMAVNVIPEVDLQREYHFGNRVSGWQALWSKLNPIEQDLDAPTIFENLVRVVALNDVHQSREKRKISDLFIQPPVERYGILNFGAYGPIIQIGYETGKRALNEWRDQIAESRPPGPVEHLSRVLDELDEILSGFV